MFYHQMKHYEIKYDAHRNVFDELRGVLFVDELLCRMLGITSQ